MGPFQRALHPEPVTPHWMGTLVINPFNSDQVLFTTGYGIWSCTNATAADTGRATRWVFLDQGLEETVPLALISPPTGAHLLSGVGDIDGFRHDDLDSLARRRSFHGPRYSQHGGHGVCREKPRDHRPHRHRRRRGQRVRARPFRRMAAKPGALLVASRPTAPAPAPSPSPRTAGPLCGPPPQRPVLVRWTAEPTGPPVRGFRPACA